MTAISAASAKTGIAETKTLSNAASALSRLSDCEAEITLPKQGLFLLTVLGMAKRSLRLVFLSNTSGRTAIHILF